MDLGLVLELLVDRLELSSQVLEFALLLIRFLLQLKDLGAELRSSMDGQLCPAHCNGLDTLS